MDRKSELHIPEKYVIKETGFFCYQSDKKLKNGR